MRIYRRHIQTTDAILVFFDSGNPESVTKEDDRYERLMALINEHADPVEISKIFNVADAIIRSSGKFSVENGVVVIDGEPLPNALSEHLLALVNAHLETTPLENFWSKLRNNESAESRRDLYAFLTVNRVPITPDGCFVAYKRVAHDYRDIHSRKYDNSPGRVISMPRASVDPDRNQTCAPGLHVAAWDYAKNHYGSYYGTTNADRMMEVKVDPRNVVAVPTDYSNQKMRVCEYEVMKDCEHEFTGVLYGGGFTEDTRAAENTEAIRRTVVDDTITADDEGHLCVPSNLVDRIKRKSEFLYLALSQDEHDKAPIMYLSDSEFIGDAVARYDADELVQISPTVLGMAGFTGHEEFSIRVNDGMLEIREYQGELVEDSDPSPEDYPVFEEEEDEDWDSWSN